jgi:hypothetical protein
MLDCGQPEPGASGPLKAWRNRVLARRCRGPAGVGLLPQGGHKGRPYNVIFSRLQKDERVWQTRRFELGRFPNRPYVEGRGAGCEGIVTL